jgi:hypothetical protein
MQSVHNRPMPMALHYVLYGGDCMGIFPPLSLSALSTGTGSGMMTGLGLSLTNLTRPSPSSSRTG